MEKRNSMWKKISWLAVVLVCIVALSHGVSGAGSIDPPVIVVAGDVYFPPYEFIDDRNDRRVYRGFNVDIIKAVAQEIGVEVQFSPMRWEDALKALEEGKVDAVAGMKYDAQRGQVYDFSEEYAINSLAIFVRKETTVISALEDLTNRRVAVQKDDISYQQLKGKNVLMESTSDQEEAFRLLLDGKVEAVLGNKLAGQYILQRLQAMDKVKTVGGAIQPERYCMAVRKGNGELLQQINKGIQQIKKNGTYDKIYMQWFGDPLDYPAYYYKRYLYYLLGVAGLALAAMFAFWRWNVALEKEVRQRTSQLEEVNQELWQKNAYIKNVNRYQDQVLNVGYGGILTGDREGKIRFANGYAREFLRLGGHDQVEDIPDEVCRTWVRNLLQGPPNNGESKVHSVWVEYLVSDMGDEETGQGERVLHFRDISEERRLREEVAQKDKLEALGQLVACIAHELRTPITSIKGFIELLPHKYENAEFRDKMLRFVPQELDRLNRVVHDLLAYAHPGTMVREVISLKTLVDEIMIFFADAFSRKGMVVEIKVDETMLVFVDKQQMKQVIINILMNAVQAMEEKDNPRLSICGVQSEFGWELRVVDNGTGIAKDKLGKIFEPFFTTKNNGTGLGLFVSYQLAKQNDVTFVVESEEGQGTRAILRFFPVPGEVA